MAGMSVDGLVSGLSTSALISQLLQVEAMPQTQLEGKVKLQESVVSALQAVNAKFLSLLTAAKDLAKETSWDAMRATASSVMASAVSAAGATAGQVTFSVTALAKAESRVSDEFAVIGDILDPAAGGDITLSNSKGSLTVAATDLDSVVTAINADTTLGLRAAAVQVSDGRYRLQVTAEQTGADSAFTVSGFATAPTVVRAAADAEIYLGGTATGVKVTSKTNTFTGLMTGTNVTVAELTGAGETVTVTVAADKTAISGKVKAVVDAANAALSEIDKYAATSDLGAGVLAGDSTVRRLSARVLEAVSSVFGGSLAAYGVELSQEGRLTFDSAAFDTGYTADPARAEAAFRTGVKLTQAAGVPAGAVTVTGSGLATQTGDRDVVVTRAATRTTGTIGHTGGLTSATDGSMLSLTMNGKTVSITATDGATLADGTVIDTVGDGAESLASMAARLNEQAQTAGLGATVSYDSTAKKIVVTADAYGSAATFTLSGTGDFGAATSTAGLDVQGTVGGVAATGAGRQLTTSDGVSIKVDLDAAELAATAGGLVGTLSYAPGFAERLQAVGDEATRVGTGLLTTALLGRDALIDDMQLRIEDWDRRLELRKAALMRQFSAMEVALSRLQQQSNWLAGQIAGLPTNVR